MARRDGVGLGWQWMLLAVVVWHGLSVQAWGEEPRIEVKSFFPVEVGREYEVDRTYDGEPSKAVVKMERRKLPDGRRYLMFVDEPGEAFSVSFNRKGDMISRWRQVPDHDRVIRYSPAAVMYPATMERGKGYAHKSEMTFYDINDPSEVVDRGTVVRKMVYEGDEAVAVNGKRLEGVHRVRVEVEADLKGTITYEATEIHWFADGVGEVKRQVEERISVLGPVGFNHQIVLERQLTEGEIASRD